MPVATTSETETRLPVPTPDAATMTNQVEKDRTRAGTRGRYHIEALQRGLDILATFTAQKPTQSLSEIAAALSLSASSALRPLTTLVDLGFLEEHVDSNRYQPSAAALKVGYTALAISRLRIAALPTLRRLHQETGETIHLAVILSDGVYHIERFERQDAHTLNISRGARFPIHCTSSGRVMVAYLPEGERTQLLDRHPHEQMTPRTITDRRALENELARIREDGYAVSMEEVFLGLAVTSAPIFDKADKPIASINIRTPTSRYDEASIRRQFAPLAIGAGAEISARLESLPSVPISGVEEESDIGSASLPPDRPIVPASRTERSRYHVEALARGLMVLSLFSPRSPQLTFREVTQATALTTSTAFRVLATLEGLGYVETDPVSGAYHPGLESLRLGFAALASADITDGARATLMGLRERVDTTVSLSVRTEGQIVERLTMRRYEMMPSHDWSSPPHATAAGKLLLAYMGDDERDVALGDRPLAYVGPNTVVDRARLERQLADTRGRAVCIADEERAPGVREVAAPVFDHDGACVAAVSAIASTTRVDLDTLHDEIAHHVAAAAQYTSEWLFWRGPVAPHPLPGIYPQPSA